MTRELTTRTMVVHVRVDGVVVGRHHDRATSQTLADARENVAAVAQLGEGRKRLLLIDARIHHALEPGVRKYYASPEGTKPTAALAILTDIAGPARLLANLFIGVTAPLAPTRVFTDEDQAIAWLLKIGRALQIDAS